MTEVITKVPCIRDKYVPPCRVSERTVAGVGEGQKQNLPAPTAFRGVQEWYQGGTLQNNKPVKVRNVFHRLLQVLLCKACYHYQFIDLSLMWFGLVHFPSVPETHLPPTPYNSCNNTLLIALPQHQAVSWSHK